MAGPLTSSVEFDVVIIGGGFTGCSAALHLAESGASVCLLEAEGIGHGGSGRNVGLVNAGLWTPPDEVESVLGRDNGQRLNAALAEGPDLVFELIDRLKIECEATRKGTLHCAHSRAGLADLNKRLAQQTARGAPVELLDARETAQRTGSGIFYGSLLDHRAGTIQPLAYARGLARAAIGAGAIFYQQSPVTRYRHDGTHWHVKTDQGAVTARALIEATNAYEWRETPTSAFAIVNFSQFATEPLDASYRQAILAGGEGCWDTATVMSSFRMDENGRLIVGAVGDIEGWGGALHRDWARRKIGATFPVLADILADIEFEHIWGGRIAMTNNHIPRISSLGPNGVSIYGYCGRGISPGTVFGKAAASWALNGDLAEFPMPARPFKREANAELKQFYYECGASLSHFLNSRFGS